MWRDSDGLGAGGLHRWRPPVVEQVRALLGPIGAVAVKEEIGGGAALGMSTRRAQEEIRRGVEQAIRDRARARDYKLAGPYTMCSR